MVRDQGVESSHSVYPTTSEPLVQDGTRIAATAGQMITLLRFFSLNRGCLSPRKGQMISKPARSIKDECETIAKDHLINLGFERIVYEPDGNNPPDFLVDDRIAVEVRRLNQNELTETGFRGLEEIRIPTEERIRKLLVSLGPAKANTSWFVGYKLKRPILPWGQIEPELRRRLEVFRDNTSNWEPCQIILGGFELDIFLKAGDPHPTFFVYGGGCDEDTGGFEFVETQKNLRLCIAEKTLKVARVRHKYPEWWLILVDRIGYGVTESDRKLFTEHLGIDHEWDKVILLSPLDPRMAFEVPGKRTRV